MRGIYKWQLTAIMTALLLAGIASEAQAQKKLWGMLKHNDSV